MRSVMASMGDWQGVTAEGRKQPLYYYSCSEWPPTVVLGHYESPCGGCDTIGSARAVYELIMEHIKAEPTRHILCEGLLLSEDSKWSLTMPDLWVVFLTTGLESCLTRIKGRREAAGNDKPLNPDNTANRVAVIERARLKLTANGVKCRRASSEQAPGVILDWLRSAGSTGAPAG